jgi:hypothetical protein
MCRYGQRRQGHASGGSLSLLAMLMMFFKYFKIPPLSASLGRWSEDGEEGANIKEHDVTENRIQVAVQKTYYLRRRTQEKGLEMRRSERQQKHITNK